MKPETRLASALGPILLAVFSLHTMALNGCTQSSNSGRRVVVYTSVDQVFSEPVFKYCGKQTGLDVRAVFDTEETKSTGVLNRLVAEASHPQADVFWSGDPIRPFILISKGLVQPYISPVAKEIPSKFKADDGTWTGIAARARVFLVNEKMIQGGPSPCSVKDLASPSWKGEAAIANPLFGTTTVHVASLFAAWGDEQAEGFLTSLKSNGVKVAGSNGEVKRLVASGEVAFGLTDTDDAYQAVKSGAPVEIVYPDQDGMGTLFMPTSVVLIKNGPNPDGGRRLIDCLLGAEVERRMAEAAAHMPLRPGVKTPPGVKSASEVKAMNVDYAAVATLTEKIQPWLRNWVGY